MDAAEKKKIKLEIQKRINETQNSIKSLTKQAKPVAPDNAIGRITRMDAIGQKNMAESNLRTAREALLNLEAALVKLDQPHFGQCIRCKKQIPLGRVLIVPEATCCVHCA